MIIIMIHRCKAGTTDNISYSKPAMASMNVKVGDISKVGKVDNSASMQRAIERVSRERNVKKNVSTSLQKKPTKASSSINKSCSNTTSSSKVSSGTKKVKAPATKTSSRSSGSSSSSSATTHKVRSVSSTNSKDRTVTKKAGKIATITATTAATTAATATRRQSKDGKTKEVCEKKTSKKLHELHSAHPEEKKMEIYAIPEDAKIQDDVKKDKTKGEPVIEEEAELIKANLSMDIEKKLSTDSSVRFGEASPEEQDDDREDSRELTRKLITDILRDGDDEGELSFEYQGYDVPISYSADVTYDMAAMALESSPFNQWQNKMSRVVGTKHLEIRHIEIQSVDFFEDTSTVDMIKMNTMCALVDEELKTEEEILSGVCYLRDSYVALLLELFCIEDESSWSILVDKPRVPIGSVTTLELPVGRVDEEEERLLGFEMEEIEDAFGLQLYMSDLTNLSKEAYEYNSINNELGMCPSPGHSGEHVKIMHLKKKISKDHLLLMRKKFSEQREQGAFISLRVVPLHEMWKVSADMKIMCALFLLEKINSQEDDFDDEMSVSSVSIRGKRFVSSMLSNVRRGALMTTKSIDL